VILSQRTRVRKVLLVLGERMKSLNRVDNPRWRKVGGGISTWYQRFDALPAGEEQFTINRYVLEPCNIYQCLRTWSSFFPKDFTEN
jgi:hypothetical protein